MLRSFITILTTRSQLLWRNKHKSCVKTIALFTATLTLLIRITTHLPFINSLRALSADRQATPEGAILKVPTFCKSMTHVNATCLFVSYPSYHSADISIH